MSTTEARVQYGAIIKALAELAQQPQIEDDIIARGPVMERVQSIRTAADALLRAALAAAAPSPAAEPVAEVRGHAENFGQIKPELFWFDQHDILPIGAKLYAAPGAHPAPNGHPVAIPGSWKLVPEEATPQMLLVGADALTGRTRGKAARYTMNAAWTAMLSAAPAAPMINGLTASETAETGIVFTGGNIDEFPKRGVDLSSCVATTADTNRMTVLKPGRFSFEAGGVLVSGWEFDCSNFHRADGGAPSQKDMIDCILRYLAGENESSNLDSVPAETASVANINPAPNASSPLVPSPSVNVGLVGHIPRPEFVDNTFTHGIATNLKGEVPAEPSAVADALAAITHVLDCLLRDSPDEIEAAMLDRAAGRLQALATPPARDAGLSDEEFDELAMRLITAENIVAPGEILVVFRAFGRAILAAAQEKRNG